MREMCRGVGLKSCVVWIIGPAYSSSGQESSCASGSTSPPKILITAPTRRTKTTVTPTPTPKADCKMGFAEFYQRGRDSRFKDIKEDETASDDAIDGLPRARRRMSETLRTQYINTKDFRVFATTWNVGGQIPPDDLDIDGWLDVNEPSDFYVIGLQEIVPLNAGNIFGAEDSRPITKWENIIRETLDRVRPATSKVKSFSDPPSPSKFKPADDIPDIEEEILLESDSDIGEEVHPMDDETINSGDSKGISVTNEIVNIGSQVQEFTDRKPGMPTGQDLLRQSYPAKRLDRLYSLRTDDCSLDDEATSGVQFNGKLTRMLSGSERIGLSWPEPPLNLLSQHLLERRNSFRTMKSFKSSKSFRTYNSFKSAVNDMPSEIALLAELKDLQRFWFVLKILTYGWCDRILSYGRAMRLLSYRRAELKLSDHRPVTATYAVEVEVFCPRRLQRALTFTDAEIENGDIVMDMGIDVGVNCLKLEQGIA
ncbi:hypothetical protein C1H46_030167 [Malus baccata]|uniref:Inositol polyphosphate-related phosphatase domain-containing protein n=1 Tax=Malus baccata TaxID=106549 RepID=A0A540LCR9_MALBA|nr:hypothetical protein C1H46_030167 [Malus baccata]